MAAATKKEEIINAGEVVKLLDTFRAAHPDDWLQQLHIKSTKLGPYTVGELTDAIRNDRFTGWEEFVPEDERDISPSSFSDFVRTHYNASLPDWTPTPPSSSSADASGNGKASKKFRTASTPPLRKALRNSDPLDMLEGVHEYADINPGDETEIDETISSVEQEIAEDHQPPVKTVFGAASERKKSHTVKPSPEKIDPRIFTYEKIALSIEETLKHEPGAEFKGMIKHGPLSENGIVTWETVDEAIRDKTRGLTDEICPYKDLKDLKQRGLPYITPAMIMDSVEKTFKAEKTGKIPSLRSGKIMHGALADKGLTWMMIDLYIREKRHGLTAENCPFRGLGGFIFAECFKINVRQIEASMRKTLENNPDGSEVLDGLILHGPLADNHRTWDMVRDYMRRKLKGLTPQNCPYKDTTEILQKRIQQITPAELEQSIRETIRQTGEIPGIADGRIKHGPLAHRRLSWEMVNDFIKNKTNGLTAQNCTEKNLAEFTKNRVLGITLDGIVDSLKATFRHFGAVIRNLEGRITHGALDDGQRTWGMVRNFVRNKDFGLTPENCPYETLPNIVDEKVLQLTVADIVEAARLQLEAEGKLSLRGQKIRYGRLGEEGFWTWDMVRGAVEQKDRFGLTDENCPYATLPELLEAFNVRQRAPQFRIGPTTPPPEFDAA